MWNPLTGLERSLYEILPFWPESLSVADTDTTYVSADVRSGNKTWK